MNSTKIISSAVDTISTGTACGAVQLPPKPDVSLVDYFVDGNPIIMSIITLFLVAILFAAWKAPAWVKELGTLSLTVSVFITAVVFFQLFDLIYVYGECSFRVMCSGIKIAMLPLLYGLLVYAISLIIRILQKPRL